MSNMMFNMATAKARYSNDPKDQLIGVVIDPKGFKKPDGSLDSDALAHEGCEWAQKQFKKIEADKAASEGKADG
jgi:hypothetical protein